MQMFSLDTEAAKSVTATGNRINESGIYSGMITRAEWTSSTTSQAQFLNFDFKSDEGMESNYMSICYKKGDGAPAFGFDIMMAIMACCKLRAVTKQNVGGKDICPELTNVRITLGLQATPDWYQDKETYEWRPKVDMNISIPFVHGTNETAKELLNQDPAETIKTIKILDRKAKPKPDDQPSNDTNTSSVNNQNSYANQKQSGVNSNAVNPAATEEWDDDIPF